MNKSMKIACLYLVASTASAFAPSSAWKTRAATTSLAATRPDTSQAVAAALEASKKYGATSPEARLAWEAVEEQDASDNRYVPSKKKKTIVSFCLYVDVGMWNNEKDVKPNPNVDGRPIGRIFRPLGHSGGNHVMNKWHASHFLSITDIVSHSTFFLSSFRSVILFVLIHSAATKGTLADECELTDEEYSAACMDYEAKMEELKGIVGNFEMSKFYQMKALTNELSDIKLTVAKASKQDSPQLRDAVSKAMAEAKKISEEKGADSPEAKVAWTEVEEVASSGLQNAVGAGLDEECLVDTAMEACQALEELNRALTRVGITK